jgi:hypothetical protein
LVSRNSAISAFFSSTSAHVGSCVKM